LKDKEHIFLYGTLLLEDFDPMQEVLLHYGTHVGFGLFTGILFDIDDYPGAIPDESTGSEVAGAVLRLSEAEQVLAIMDEYEGYDPDNEKESLFVRKKLSIKMESGKIKKCWIYLYNKDTCDLTRIPHGNYLKYLSEKEDPE
jgi:gamma-glutamylcyclotransferase (GGCT)/AIG2-like uncharacterized protein YtfP